MKTNREKFNQLASKTNKQVLEDIAFRKTNRDWLRQSKRIAAKVLMALDAQGLSQKDLAKKLDVSPQYISKLVKGRENLTLETVVKLEKALHIIVFEQNISQNPARHHLNYTNLDAQKTWERQTYTISKRSKPTSIKEGTYSTNNYTLLTA